MLESHGHYGLFSPNPLDALNIEAGRFQAWDAFDVKIAKITSIL
jgi:hypothetical protein